MTQYVQAKVEKLEHPITAWVLLGMIAVSVMMYAYFIQATVSNIVAAKDMQSQVTTLTASVGALESKYLAEESSLTLNNAIALGYTQSDDNATVYISKAAASSLSFR